MIANIGLLALALALPIALLQSGASLWGAQRNHDRLMQVGRNAALMQAALLALAFACLVIAFLSSDFSLALVVAHSHSAKPFLYKFAASWGNHEGSLALWVLVLALAGGALAILGESLAPRLRARALGIQGSLGVLFTGFLLFASNPFERLPTPALDGFGLNPVLQDPALAIHPPFLYFGYVGLSLPFSLAVAALLEGGISSAWARWLRITTLASWSALTIGIALGSWWAYRELGWGGFWFWDPVENASLMPWLIAIALFHCAVIVEKRGAFRQWSIFLAIIAFSLAMLGTFLVRSGVLVSVHSFATDPTRGIFILAILVCVSGGALLLFSARAARLRDDSLFAPVSREGAVLVNNLLLCCGCASVFVGTLYPLALETLNGAKVSVGAPFFNLTFAPLMLPLFFLLPLGPVLAWKQGSLLGALQRIQLAALVGLAAIIGTLAYKGAAPLWASLAFGLGVWILVGVCCEIFQRLRSSESRPGASFWGMSLAHAGMGVLLLGVVAHSAWSIERIESLRPGDSLDVAGFNITFENTAFTRSDNFFAEQALLRVRSGNGEVFDLTAERRVYPIRATSTSESAINYSLAGDLYVVLGDNWIADAEARVFRFYWNPLVSLIWLGAALMAIGGGCCLADRRYRASRPEAKRGWESRQENLSVEEIQ
ncbi:MAG: heme lyase CcmF/NrfE family subunit [Hyphomicrobiales bacterium]|nr:heme lyase CcmF/NrfE family subunit [Hyphomicrobiales bacterium]